MNHGCIVHYPNQTHYATLKNVLEISKEKICAAKVKRFSLGGHLHHKFQSNVRVFQIILLLTRITFILTDVTKG